MTQSPEERRRRNVEAVRRYNERKRGGISWSDTDGPAMIGEIAPLAEGHVNPMWETERGLQSMVERVGPYLEVTRPKKTKLKTISAPEMGKFLMKTVEVEIDDV